MLFYLGAQLGDTGNSDGDQDITAKEYFHPC